MVSKNRDRDKEARATVAAEAGPKGPGFTVTHRAGPGGGAPNRSGGMPALRSKLGLSDQPGANEVASAAVARITELERTLENLRPTAKVDARSRATFAG